MSKVSYKGPFTKESLLAVMDDLSRRINTRHFVLGFGGVLCLYGIRDITGDVDLLIKYSDRSKVMGLGAKEIESYMTGTQTNAVIYNLEDIDFHLGNNLKFTPDEIVPYENGKFMIMTLESIYRFKKEWNREKDQEDIRKLKEVLGY